MGERVITNADFVRAMSYMASNCGSWAGDSLIFPEEMTRTMKLEPLRRFIAGMRERLDRIDPDWRDPATGEERELLFAACQMPPVPCTCNAGRVMLGSRVWSPCVICDGTGDRTKNRNYREGYTAGFAVALARDTDVHTGEPT